MSPKQWGPPLWHAINIIARCYPENPSISDMRKYRAFFTALGNVLPCRKCQRHYRSHISAIGTIPVASRTQLVDFVAQLHNRVNSATGKEIMPLPEARAHIMAAGKGGNMTSLAKYIAMAIIISFIIQFITR